MSCSPHLAAALLAVTAALATPAAQAQARGPSVAELRENGRRIVREAPDRRALLAAIARQHGLEPRDLESGELRQVPGKGWVLQRGDEEIELLGLRRVEVLDESARASKHAQQAAWLGRLVGRFRVQGSAERMAAVGIEAGGSQPIPGISIRTLLVRDISGVADCAAVGTGAGVQCFINAIWPTIEPLEGSALQRTMAPAPASEQAMVLRPAVMVLGLNPDTAEIRASMVTDDSIAHTWSGRLEADTLTAHRRGSCFVSQTGAIAASSPPCFQPLEIIAEPDSDLVTMVHRAAGVTLRLQLHRDPDARADQPMKSKRVR